jgi:hypothetical protein
MGAFFLASRADRGRGGFNGHVTQGTSPRLSTTKLTGAVPVRVMLILGRKRRNIRCQGLEQLFAP